jgi:hypothetical protein
LFERCESDLLSASDEKAARHERVIVEARKIAALHRDSSHLLHVLLVQNLLHGNQLDDCPRPLRRRHSPSSRPRRLHNCVGVEGRIDVDQIDAAVRELGELFEIIPAVDDAGVEQRRRPIR